MVEVKRVALCVTCLVDQFLPEVGIATVKVLERAGCLVDFPEDQTCCGQPFFNSGFREQALRLAIRTIEIFEPFGAIVLPSGSCTTMIRAEYPHLLAERPEWWERARRLAAKTFELSQFLVHEAGWQPERDSRELSDGTSVSPTVTYHDSCHMCRTLGLRTEPRQLLAASGLSLREMDESDRCCGFGGLFSLKMPMVSTAITAEKLRQATESKASTLVTADPGCLMQMRRLTGDTGPTVQHLATVLEERTR